MHHARWLRVHFVQTIVMSASGTLVAAGGCAVPTGTGDHEEETLTAHVETTPAELKALDEIEFWVEIEDAMGNHTTDMEEVRLEVREAGGEWVEISVTAGSESFMGTGIFSSSGDYELRVLGMQHMGHMLEEMHTMSFHVDRAHTEAAGFHIEFESDPGHIHAGEATMLMFWVATEETGDPVNGLMPEIVVEESDGHMTTLEAQEVEPGLYQAVMSFADSGEAHATISFLDGTGEPVEGDFHFLVAEAH